MFSPLWANLLLVQVSLGSTLLRTSCVFVLADAPSLSLSTHLATILPGFSVSSQRHPILPSHTYPNSPPERINTLAFAATGFGEKEQRTVAWINVGMLLGCFANMIVNPVADKMPPPAVAYCTIVPAVYVAALVAGGDKSKKN